MRRGLVLVALVGAITAAGCGGGGGSASSTTTGSSSTTQPTTTTGPRTTTSQTTTAASGPTTIRVAVVRGVPKGGIVRASVRQGDRAVLVVSSDVADEIHLHGYDVTADVTAGGTARLPFTATIPGRFEVELEKSGIQIADVTVEP